VSAHVLIVDDEPRYRRVVELLLEGEGYRISTAGGGAEALEMLTRDAVDVVLTDLQMPRVDGLAVLARAAEVDPDLPVIVFTAYGTVRSAVDAMRRGAFDYVEKPFDDDTLRLQVARAVATRRLRRQNRALRSSLGDASGFHRILGDSAPLRAAVDLARRVAPTDTTVLLLGESGTGKELFARAVHEGSARSEGPFVKVNCAAIPATLLEAELFGVEKGAFTGAERAKAGHVERAHGGTLFLDEVGELEVALQPKLLRMLEERVVERLGGGRPRAVDVRIVAATNRDLGAAVAAGGFRVDLFHRLAVFPITLPPLRERREDVPALVRFFVRRFNEAMGRAVQDVSAAALGSLERLVWPGNVRELANMVERAMILCPGPLLEPEHFVAMQTAPARTRFELPAEGVSLEDVEVSLLRQAMERAGGNKVVAARLLGLTRNTLRYRLEKHGLG
jgi:two-component system NtrC family response regulator